MKVPDPLTPVRLSEAGNGYAVFSNDDYIVEVSFDENQDYQFFTDVDYCIKDLQPCSVSPRKAWRTYIGRYYEPVMLSMLDSHRTFQYTHEGYVNDRGDKIVTSYHVGEVLDLSDENHRRAVRRVFIQRENITFVFDGE